MEAVGLTDFIGGQSQFAERIRWLMQLLAVHKAHGIDDQVRVDVRGIDVRGDENLIVRIVFLSKLQCDFVRSLG